MAIFLPLKVLLIGKIAVSGQKNVKPGFLGNAQQLTV